VVDTAWDPPVTLAVRLVSVISDDLQHAGQAAFARGVLSRAITRSGGLPAIRGDEVSHLVDGQRGV
jgi:hypothetical protein